MDYSASLMTLHPNSQPRNTRLTLHISRDPRMSKGVATEATQSPHGILTIVTLSTWSQVVVHGTAIIAV